MDGSNSIDNINVRIVASQIVVENLPINMVASLYNVNGLLLDRLVSKGEVITFNV